MKKTFRNSGKDDFHLLVNVGSTELSFFLRKGETFSVDVSGDEDVEFSSKSEGNFELEEVA